jgi:hypothetical protein
MSISALTIMNDRGGLSREGAGEQEYRGELQAPAELRRAHDARYEQLERETVLPLGTALIIIPLLSLGLWWAVLSVAWPLASGLLE